MSVVGLLRACLELQAVHGDKVNGYMRDISRTVKQSEKNIRTNIEASALAAERAEDDG